jgi:uncharacterized protein
MEDLENQERNTNTDPEDFRKNIFPRMSPVGAAFLGLFGGFFLYQILGGTLHLLIFGTDLTNAPANGIRLLTMAGQVLFILLPALILTKLVYEDVTEIIRVRLPDLKGILLFSIGIIILTPLLQYFLFIQNYLIVEWAKISPAINSLKELLDSLNEMVEGAYGTLLRADNIFEGLLVIFVMAVVPAVTEEFMFRGFIQRSFEFKMKPFWAALITAIFFGLFHFNLYGLIPLIGLGFYFGFAAYVSNSIFIPIILHFLNNFAAVMLFFVIGDEELIKSSPTPDVDIGSSVFMFFIFLVLFIGLLTVIKKYYKDKRRIYAGMSEL